MRISDWSSDVCSSDLLRPSASAQSDGKNDEIEQRRDRRCPDRLELDLEEPPHLLHIERATPAPIDVPDHGHAGGIRHRRLDFAAIGRASCRERVWQYV